MADKHFFLGASLAMSLIYGLHAQSPPPSSFVNCINPPNGICPPPGTRCTLPPGIYSISSTLRINCSVTVEGGGITPSQTVLRRSANIPRIMDIKPGLQNVTIQYLTFDGNRYGQGLGLNCLPGNSHYWDLDLRLAGRVTVQYVDFLRAPGDALSLGGDASTISYSNFGTGGSPSATRSTAMRIYGKESGAYYNNVYYAGTAGINVSGRRQYVYGNTLGQNRYEQSDGSPGGQLYLEPTSEEASFAANIINGNYWQAPHGAYINGCLVMLNPDESGHIPPYGVPAGIEWYGNGHRFYNNAVIQHMGTGVQLAGSNPTRSVTIAGHNPWDPGDLPRYIQNNNHRGIWALDRGWPVAGITLDHVRVIYNNNWGIYLESVSGTGFINGACIQGNQHDIATPNHNLTYPLPSYISCP